MSHAAGIGADANSATVAAGGVDRVAVLDAVGKALDAGESAVAEVLPSVSEVTVTVAVETPAPPAPEVQPAAEATLNAKVAHATRIGHCRPPDPRRFPTRPASSQRPATVAGLVRHSVPGLRRGVRKWPKRRASCLST